MTTPSISPNNPAGAKRRPSPSIRRLAAAILLALSLLRGPAFAEEPPSQAACAAKDLELVWEIEDLAESLEVHPGHLFAAYELVLEARRLCDAGRYREGVALYDRIAPGVIALRPLP